MKPTDDGMAARYCHWDGYPDWNGKVIFEIVQRDGVEKAREVLIDQHTYWSTLDSATLPEGTDANTEPGTKVPTDQQRWDRPNTYVVGYGEADLNEGDLITEDFGGSWCEWAYLIEDDGLRIGKIDSDIKWVLTIPWTEEFDLKKVLSLTA